MLKRKVYYCYDCGYGDKESLKSYFKRLWDEWTAPCRVPFHRMSLDAYRLTPSIIAREAALQVTKNLIFADLSSPKSLSYKFGDKITYRKPITYKLVRKRIKKHKYLSNGQWKFY